MSEPIIQKTDEEKLADLNKKLSTLANETGFLQYNIKTYLEDLERKNLDIKNTIIDHNKISERIEKAKKNPANNLGLVPTDTTQAEVTNVVQ